MWNKSPFTKKYKTHPPRANGKILILIYRYINYQNRRTFSLLTKLYLCFFAIDGKSLSGMNGRSNVYNVSSATLTSYTSYNNDGGDHSLDEASLPNHYGLPAVNSSNNLNNRNDRERQVLFSVRTLLIVLALSVHSIFEGMAIGKNLNLCSS